MSDAHRGKGARVLAVLLVIGGVLGVGLAFWMGYQFIPVHWIYSVLVAGFLALFVWAVMAGIRLWRGEAKGWKWATILFALQIPVLTVPGLSYEFYTGLALKLVGGNVRNTFAFNIGSNANFYLDTRVTDLIYGINVFAVAALIYLLRRRPGKDVELAADGYE